MRLALVMSHADRSMAGAQRELCFCVHLQKLGVEVSVFRIHSGREVEIQRYNGSRVPVVFCPSDAAEPIPHKLTSAAMVEAIREFEPTVVIFKGLNYDINAFVRAGLDKKIPAGFIVGGSVNDKILADASFVFGEYVEQLDRFFPSFVSSATAFIMPKFVEFAWCDGDHQSDVPPPHPEFDIVNVGSFSEKRKNQTDLLPLAELYRIALIGSGTLQPDFLRNVANKENVSVLGRLAHQDVFKILRNSKIMVHTSTMDGLPRAVVEAMACGLPVVAYRSTLYGGLRQGIHGFLTEPDALPHAVHLLLKDEHLRMTMGKHASAYVKAHHGPAAIRSTAKKFVDFMRR